MSSLWTSAVMNIGHKIGDSTKGPKNWYKRFGFADYWKRTGQKPKKKPKRGLEITYSGTSEPRRIIYGFQRVGGMHTIPPFCTGENGKYLHMVLTLAGHEVSSFGNVWFDNWEILDSDIGSIQASDASGEVFDGPYKRLTNIRRFGDGAVIVAADYILTQAYPSAFDSNFKGEGMTYAAIRLKYQKDVFATGLPEMRFEVYGKKVYDPRLDSTNGGTGTHRYTDDSTWEYSTNPALCVRDYLVNEVGFDNSEIDDTLVAAAANVCDEDVAVPTSTTEDRYRCNVTLLANDPWEDNLETLLGSMHGWAAWVDGKWRINAGAWATPVAAITKDDWVSDLAIQTSADRSDRWNAVRAFYYDAARNFQNVECFPRRNAAYETADGGERIWLELTLPAVITEFQAQRIAELWLRRSRNQITVAGRLRPEFLQLAPGDTITATDDELGWSSKTFRIVTMDISPEGEVDVVMREEGSTMWSDLAEGDYNNPAGSTQIDPGATYPTPATSLVASGGRAVIDFTWLPSSDELMFQTYRLLEGVNSSDATLANEIWRGLAYQATVPKADTTTRWYWVQGVVGSYLSAYWPNTFGVAACASTPPADGTPGTYAPGLSLQAEGQVFRFSGSGTNIGVSTIGFSALLDALPGVTAGFYARNYRADGTALNSYGLSGTGNSNRGLHVNSFLQNGSTAWCTVVASCIGGFNDRVTVVRVQEGAAGAQGAVGSPGLDAIVGYLTNEAVVLPASSNGFVPSYAGASGLFPMFLGINSIHPNSITYSVQVESPVALASSISNVGSYIVESGLPDASPFGSVLFRGAYNGTSIDKLFTITKALAGTAGSSGSNAAMLNLIPTGQQFRFSGSGTSIGPSTIGFYIDRQFIGDTAAIYANNYLANGTLINSVALASGALAANSRWAFHVNSFIRNGSTAYATIVASAAGYFDQVSVVRLQEGADGSQGSVGSPGLDAIAGLLTNEAFTLPSSSNGYVPSYSGADGYFHLWEGVNLVNPSSVTFAVESNAQNLTASISAASGYYSVTDGLDLGEDVGLLGLKADYKAATIRKMFTISKSRGGTAGNDAKILALNATGQQFRYSGSGTSIGVSTIGFYIDRENIAATAGIYAANYRSNGALINSVALSAAALATNSQWIFNVNSFTRSGSTAYATVVASAEGYWDQVTIVRLQEGADGSQGAVGSPGLDALVGYLTNEAHTLPASYNGYVPSYAGANGYFQLFKGVTPVSPTSITFAVESNAQALTANISAASGYYDVSAGLDLGEDVGLLGLKATYDGTDVRKLFTLSKSKAGDPGAVGSAAYLFALQATGQAFRYSGSGTVIGANTIGFYINQQNLSGAAGIYAANYRTGGVLINSVALAGPVNSQWILHVNSFTRNGSTAWATIVASLNAAGATWSDQMTVVRLQEGAAGATGATGSPGLDAIVGFLTNEVHTVPASSNGQVTNYSGANGYFILYEGVNPVLPTSITFAVGSNAQGLTGTVTPSANSGYYAVTGGLDSGEELGLLDMTATYRGTAIQKIFTLGKNKQGITGDVGSPGLDGEFGGSLYLGDDPLFTKGSSVSPNSYWHIHQYDTLNNFYNTSSVHLQNSGGLQGGRVRWNWCNTGHTIALWPKANARLHPKHYDDVVDVTMRWRVTSFFTLQANDVPLSINVSNCNSIWTTVDSYYGAKQTALPCALLSGPAVGGAAWLPSSTIIAASGGLWQETKWSFRVTNVVSRADMIHLWVGAFIQCHSTNGGKGQMEIDMLDFQLRPSGGATNVPQKSRTAAYTLEVQDAGGHIKITTGGVTVPSGVFKEGDIISIYNSSGSTQNITASGVTLRLGGTSTTGSPRTMAAYGVVNLLCVASNDFVLTGNVS